MRSGNGMTTQDSNGEADGPVSDELPDAIFVFCRCGASEKVQNT